MFAQVSLWPAAGALSGTLEAQQASPASERASSVPGISSVHVSALNEFPCRSKASTFGTGSPGAGWPATMGSTLAKSAIHKDAATIREPSHRGRAVDAPIASNRRRAEVSSSDEPAGFRSKANCW